MKHYHLAHAVRHGQNCLKSLQLFTFTLFFVLSCTVSGQAQNGNDTLKITCQVSTWINNASEMEFTFDLSSYNLDNSSKPTIDIDGSWFIQSDESYVSVIEWDTLGEEIYLKLTRTSGTASGTGFVAEIGGLVIMDDIMARRSKPIAEPSGIEFELTAGPNPYVKGGGSELTFSPGVESAELWTLDGKLLTNRIDQIKNLIDQNLKPGIYLLKVSQQGLTNNLRLRVTD